MGSSQDKPPLEKRGSTSFLQLHGNIFVFTTYDSINEKKNIMNYKGELQTYLARSRLPCASYDSHESGPDHAPRFRTWVHVGNQSFQSDEKYSKKESEQEAARLALEELNACNKTHSNLSRDVVSVKHDVRPIMILLDGENVPYGTLRNIPNLHGNKHVGVWVFVQKDNPQQRAANTGGNRPLRTVLIDSTASDAVDVAIVVQATLLLTHEELKRLIIVTGDKIGIATVHVLQQMFAHLDIVIQYASSAAHCMTLFQPT
jgi:hypothetical protein